jgi:P27 family predicted phage terminase small subunit
MGRRGPPPTPTAVLEARGSWRAKINKSEMKPRSGAPKPPADLKGEALEEWKRIVKELAPTRVLTKADRSALLMYVQSWANMQEAAAKIAADGVVIALPNGYPQQNPYVAVFNAANRQCLRLLQEFGLTPSARARIPAGEKKPSDAAGDLDF